VAGVSSANLWESSDTRPWEEALKREQGGKGLEQVPPEKLGSMDAAEFLSFLKDKLYPACFQNPSRLEAARQELQSSADEDELAAVDLVRERLQYLDPEDPEWALRVASDAPGLTTCGASTLLSLVFPEHFGTIDALTVKALKSLPRLPEARVVHEIHADILTPEDGAVVIEVLRRKARELSRKGGNWTPRKVADALRSSAR
jgi:hypothetical protein